MCIRERHIVLNTWYVNYTLVHFILKTNRRLSQSFTLTLPQLFFQEIPKKPATPKIDNTLTVVVVGYETNSEQGRVYCTTQQPICPEVCYTLTLNKFSRNDFWRSGAFPFPFSFFITQTVSTGFLKLEWHVSPARNCR